MYFPSLPSLPVRITAVTMLLVAGSAVACDVDGELSPEELELLEADLADESAEDLMIAPDEGEPYVGAESRIDTVNAGIDPVPFIMMPWFSEESFGMSECPANQVVTGFDCSGSYCDNVRLECHSYGTSLGATDEVSAWFEHNGKYLHICDEGSKITAIDCWGDNCDNIKIRCTYAPGLDTARCQWSDWYSEENPSPFYAAPGDAIQGIWCSGTRCDNKRFLVCET